VTDNGQVNQVDHSERETPGRRLGFIRPMRARDRNEPNRVSTPLELLFDLCFVVGVSQAGGRLHHALAAGEFGHGVTAYLLVFFAIWWAWVNFTWFASAYDNDDVPYRLITMVQITGALTLAAGVPRAFDNDDFSVVVVGYVIMRLAMVTQWLRAAKSDPERRVTALRFAVGITVVQIGWIARLALPHSWGLASFLILALAELAVPVYAEHAANTTWHHHHIAERYGLFTLIVLGEAILSSTIAIQLGFDIGGHRDRLFLISASALVTVFAMWWLYFDRRGSKKLATSRTAFLFGYGHYFVFAAVAATGAGIGVEVDAIGHESHVSEQTGAWCVAIPVAVYALGVWLVHRLPSDGGVRSLAFPVTAALVLLSPLTGAAMPVIAVLVVALVIVTRPGIARPAQTRAPTD
jgi:low temperature requirement protein LtrA